MKKTEKIEVRLSHEEKTELSKLADEEGRSVSELIRHLVKRYMSMNTGRLPRKLPWLALAATGVIAFLAGHLLTYFIAKSHGEPVFRYYVEMEREGSRSYDSLTVPIILKDGFEESYILPRPDGDVKVDIKVEKKKGEMIKVMNSLCVQKENDCEVIATPVLSFKDNENPWIRFATDNGLQIVLGAKPADGN